MKAFFIGAMIGFLMCIPIGPLNVIVINTHIKRGFKRAMCIALGGSFMDFVYFFLILSGLSFLHFSDTSLSFFKTAGILLIFGLGLKEILSQPKLEREVQINDSASKLVGSFIFGVVIYTSNPTLVLTMSGLGTFTKSLQAFEEIGRAHV